MEFMTIMQLVTELREKFTTEIDDVREKIDQNLETLNHHKESFTTEVDKIRGDFIITKESMKDDAVSYMHLMAERVEKLEN